MGVVGDVELHAVAIGAPMHATRRDQAADPHLPPLGQFFRDEIAGAIEEH